MAPATVARVRASAAELRFIPNRGAQHLARGRTGIVPLVVPTLHNAFFTPIIVGAQTRAEAAGLHATVAVHPLEDEDERARFERLATQVDGLVIVAPRGDDELVRRACAVKPSVLVDREIDGIPSVAADTAEAFASLITQLARAGHQKVAFLNGPDKSWQNAQRTAAVRDAARNAGVRIDVLGPNPATFAAGAELADAVEATGASVALPYASDLGLGLLFELVARGRAQFGRAVPPAGAIEVVGVPGAPAVDVDGEALGAAAMDHLLTVLDGGTPVPHRLRLPVPVSEQWASPRGDHHTRASPRPAQTPRQFTAFTHVAIPPRDAKQRPDEPRRAGPSSDGEWHRVAPCGTSMSRHPCLGVSFPGRKGQVSRAERRPVAGRANRERRCDPPAGGASRSRRRTPSSIARPRRPGRQSAGRPTRLLRGACSSPS